MVRYCSFRLNQNHWAYCTLIATICSRSRYGSRLHRMTAALMCPIIGAHRTSFRTTQKPKNLFSASFDIIINNIKTIAENTYDIHNRHTTPTTSNRHTTLSIT